jgi:purine-nucleoside phosphorylase
MTSMPDAADRLRAIAEVDPDAVRAAQDLERRTSVARHDAFVVLGSGWSGAADALGTVVAELPVEELPGFLAPVADGHLGLLRSYDCAGLPVLVFLGRTHLYEGRGPGPVAHAVRTAIATGARMGVLTNANGSLRPEWATGTGVLISDHLNLSHQTPLVGARFVDQSATWSPRLRAWASDAQPSLVEGVYAMLPGPEYQTPAETQMLRMLGADVVGMSTVLEAIAAREWDVELLGLSVVTTREGTGEVIDPQEVVAVAAAAAAGLGTTIAEVIRRWAESEQ